MESDKTVLRALAEIRRRQILAIKLNPQTKDVYSNEYAFAVIRSIYPLYHEHVGFLENKDDIITSLPFYDTYDISREQVEEVANFLEESHKGEPISFYSLESHFYNKPEWNKKWRKVRIDLINVCRYFYLSGAFDDDDIWKGLLSSAPSEAKGFKKKWSNSELLIHNQF
jgi:hypothetical protein